MTPKIYIYIYLHGNCHVILFCDPVLTWECHVKEPVNQELPAPILTWEFHVQEPVNLENPPLPSPPLYGRHGNPMFPGTRKCAFTWDCTSILQDFAAGLPHMESPCGFRRISQFTWFSHVEGLFLVAVNMGIPCKDYKKHTKSTEHEEPM